MKKTVFFEKRGREYAMAKKADHRHCRRLYDPERGVRALISSDPDFEVVAEAGDGQEAIKFVEKLKPDLVLMDLSMPRMNGMDAIREIRKRVPETKIVVLTIHKTEEHILAAFKAEHLLEVCSRVCLAPALEFKFEAAD